MKMIPTEEEREGEGRLSPQSLLLSLRRRKEEVAEREEEEEENEH